jgi:hypothetical protein
MEDLFTSKFFAWADSNNVTREQIAKGTGNSKQTISKWRSIGIPRGKRLVCEALMNQHRHQDLEDLRGKMILRPTHAQFTRWNRAALSSGQTIEDWAFDGLERMADNYYNQRQHAAEDPRLYPAGKDQPA